MIGVDTNVLVRYFAQDDKQQAELATHFIEARCNEHSPGFVGLVVLVELVWVSERGYGKARADIALMLRALLNARQLVIQQAETVWRAVRLFEAGKAGFADCLTYSLSIEAGCESVVTFDKTAAKAGMTLLK